MPRRAVAPRGEVKDIVNRMLATERRVRTLEQPDAGQKGRRLQKLEQLINNLPGYIANLLAAGVTTDGNVHATGTVTGDAGVSSVGAYNNDIALLAGGRRTGWWHASGAAGYASSSKEKKTNAIDFPVPAEAFLSIGAKLFQYKALLDQRDNPENPAYCPVLHVPFEPGHFAEELVDAGLEMFVFYEEDGSPAGINYDLFAAVGFSVVGRDHEARIARLEAALATA